MDQKTSFADQFTAAVSYVDTISVLYIISY